MSPLFRNRAREEAEATLRSCDETLAILESGATDLGPAVRLRARSGELFRTRRYREALEAARKAEETAKLLDRLHVAASEGIDRLRSERARMVKLGIGVKDIDALIAAASSWMSRTVERGGDPKFPAYATAGEFALRGLRLAKERVPRFKAAAASVSDAERYVRRMVEENRFVERSAFEFFVLKPAVDALGEARAKLRANAFVAATDLARRTLASAKQIDQTYVRVTGVYMSVAEATKALRSEGGVAVEVENLLEVCRSALGRGKFDEAAGLAERAGARLRELRDEYRSLVLRERNARDAIREVEGWGFDAREPRAILEEARQRMQAGDYREAGARLDEARATALGLRETHRTTAARIAEMRRSVPAVRATSPASAEEAEGLLLKAESFLDEGRYRACEENLQLASLLLVDIDPAGPRGASPGSGLASILQAAKGIEATCSTCGGPLAYDGTCPTCSSTPEAENVEPVRAIARAVDDSRRVIAEIGREDSTLAQRASAAMQGCAMCGGPLAGEDVLCAKCQGIVKGRA